MFLSRKEVYKQNLRKLTHAIIVENIYLARLKISFLKTVKFFIYLFF